MLASPVMTQKVNSLYLAPKGHIVDSAISIFCKCVRKQPFDFQSCYNSGE